VISSNLSAELFVSIIINLLAVAFFAGVYVTTVRHLKDNIEDFKQKIEDLKDDFKQKIGDLKSNFHEKFDAVEKKQDKHNNLIERMALCEASTKSAHKRIDGITGEMYDK